MANRLELPDDLVNLIEKREKSDRRHADDANVDPPQAGAKKPPIDRRSGDDRRAEE